jgi:hypothetical protein
MATKKQLADDLYNKYSALLSQTDIQKYLGIGRNKAARIVAKLPEIGKGTGKRYFYEDVADGVLKYMQG